MNHQTRAPAVRGVDLGDLAHHLEPGIKAEAVTAEPRRGKNAGNAGAEKRIDRFPRQRARLLGRGGAVAEARGQFSHARQHSLMGITRWCLAVARHVSRLRLVALMPLISTGKSFRRSFIPKHILIDKSKAAHTQFFCKV